MVHKETIAKKMKASTPEISDLIDKKLETYPGRLDLLDDFLNEFSDNYNILEALKGPMPGILKSSCFDALFMSTGLSKNCRARCTFGSPFGSISLFKISLNSFRGISYFLIIKSTLYNLCSL